MTHIPDPTEAQIKAFKEAWLDADFAGDKGLRVLAGLQAAYRSAVGEGTLTVPGAAMKTDLMTLMTNTITMHQHTETRGCHCGWKQLGRSWAEHVAQQITAAIAQDVIDGLPESTPPKLEPKPVAPFKGPHSRACGVTIHPHGSGCHRNCPTCGGMVNK